MSEDPIDDGPDDGSPNGDPGDHDGSPSDHDGSPGDGEESPQSDDLPTFPADRTGWSDVPDVPPSRDPAEPAPGEATDPDAVDDLPTVWCSICDREWDLAYELDELAAGNRAVEQFAMDHERHTGHYPDEVTPWVADCRACPDGERFLAERPARRFAHTHARHTGHSVDLVKSDVDVAETVDPGDCSGTSVDDPANDRRRDGTTF